MRTDLRHESKKFDEIVLNARRRAAQLNAAIAAARARQAAKKAAAAAPVFSVGSFEEITGRTEPPAEVEAAPETVTQPQAEQSADLPPQPTRWRDAAPRPIEEPDLNELDDRNARLADKLWFLGGEGIAVRIQEQTPWGLREMTRNRIEEAMVRRLNDSVVS